MFFPAGSFPLPIHPEARLLVYLVPAGSGGLLEKVHHKVALLLRILCCPYCTPCSFRCVDLDMSSQLLLRGSSGHAPAIQVTDSYPLWNCKYTPPPVSCLDCNISIRTKAICNIYKVVYRELCITK